jgi:hypothetical protein
MYRSAVLHVVTVHWQDSRWIEPQLRYLRRHVVGPMRSYASLRGIDPALGSAFDVAVDLDGTHPEKLNALAELVRADADDHDLIMFLDGDAFPIAPITEALLAGAPLAAVRRDENLGQRQPHPCFCLTTVGFWREIDGDWNAGYQWPTTTGELITDVGGNLLEILQDRGVEWRPLLRSNAWNLDPLLYAVYGDVVYHHGAGFRRPLTWNLGRPAAARVRAARDAAWIPERVPVLGKLERSLRYRLGARTEQRALDAQLDRIAAQSAEVFTWIRDEIDFPERFTVASASAG